MIKNMEIENTLLTCVSCKRQLNSEVDKCPHCGKKDPFMFKKIEKKAGFLMFLDILISFLLAIKICSLFGGGLVVLAILLWVLTAVFAKIGGFFIKKHMDNTVLKMKDEMKTIYGNDEEANEWRLAMTKRIYDLLKYC
jgi:hypothetical protein